MDNNTQIVLNEKNIAVASYEQIEATYESSSYPESWDVEFCVFGDCGARATVSTNDGRVLRIAEKYQDR